MILHVFINGTLSFRLVAVRRCIIRQPWMHHVRDHSLPEREEGHGIYLRAIPHLIYLIPACHLVGQWCRLVEATGGCRAEASSLQVLTWLHSREAELMTAMYCKTDMLRGLSSEVLLHEDSLVESRCREAFQAVQRFETSHHLDDQVIVKLLARESQQVNCMLQDWNGSLSV